MRPARLILANTVDALQIAGQRWRMNAAPEMSEARAAALLSDIAQSRNRAAFIALFDHYAPRLKAQAMRFGFAADASEDVAQDAMLAVWTKAALFDPARGTPSGWIFTLSTNIRIDRVRRGMRLAAMSAASDDSPELAPSAHEALEAEQAAAGVGAALNVLPLEQRRVIELSFYRDMPHAEIARTLRLPLGTVKSRARLALARLREVLGERP